MKDKKNTKSKNMAATVLAAAFWLMAWQLAAVAIGQKLFLTSVIDKTVIEKILSCHISVISAGIIFILDFVPGIGNPHGGYTGERWNIFFKVSSHGMTDRQVVPYCGRNCVRIDRIAVFESIYRLER